MFLAVYGEDALRVREYADDLLEKFVAKYDPSRLNVEIFDFATSSKETCVSALRAAPFLSEKRFIFIKNICDTLKKADVSFWMDIFEHVDLDTSVCFVDVCSAVAWKKSYLGLWFAKLSEDKVKLFSIDPLSRLERIAWMRARAARVGSNLSDNILQAILSRVGDESQELALELHKVAAFAQTTPVTDEMLERLVPLRTSSDFFAFLDLLPTAEPEKLLRALRKEVDAGADGFMMFGGLLRQVRILAAVSDLVAQRRSSQEIATLLNVHPFVAQKAVQAVKYFSHERLITGFERAIAWDKGTKSGLSSDLLASRLLEELLFAREKSVA